MLKILVAVLCLTPTSKALAGEGFSIKQIICNNTFHAASLPDATMSITQDASGKYLMTGDFYAIETGPPMVHLLGEVNCKWFSSVHQIDGQARRLISGSCEGLDSATSMKITFTLSQTLSIELDQDGVSNIVKAKGDATGSIYHPDRVLQAEMNSTLPITSTGGCVATW